MSFSSTARSSSRSRQCSLPVTFQRHVELGPNNCYPLGPLLLLRSVANPSRSLRVSAIHGDYHTSGAKTHWDGSWEHAAAAAASASAADIASLIISKAAAHQFTSLISFRLREATARRPCCADGLIGLVAPFKWCLGTIEPCGRPAITVPNINCTYKLRRQRQL